MGDKKRGRLYRWIDERYDLSPVEQFVDHKRVPIHRQTVWYYMGGVTLFLFMIQVFTGILLLFYYQPGSESSYESIRFLMTEVNFGWLFRSIHSWSANLMVFFAFIHMFSTFFTRAYRKPRELTWVTGFVLLLLAMALGFSGYLLPWNELAFFATKVGTDIAGTVPLIGEGLRDILRGGSDVTGATLTRFYAFHVALFPALLTVVLFLHLVFVQRLGMHAPESFNKAAAEKKRDIPFFPNFVMKDALLWLVVLNILLYLAVFMPAEMGLKADPMMAAPEGIKPEWYFMFMFETLKLVPSRIWFVEGEVVAVLGFAVVILAWMLVPFWEVKRKMFGKYRPMTVIGVASLVYIILLTAYGYLA